MLGPVLVRGNPSGRDVATGGALACQLSPDSYRILTAGAGTLSSVRDHV